MNAAMDRLHRKKLLQPGNTARALLRAAPLLMLDSVDRLQLQHGLAGQLQVGYRRLTAGIDANDGHGGAGRRRRIGDRGGVPRSRNAGRQMGSYQPPDSAQRRPRCGQTSPNSADPATTRWSASSTFRAELAW